MRKVGATLDEPPNLCGSCSRTLLSGKEVYASLEHAAWNGWTFTDLVFPFFLWIAGVSMTLSFARRGGEPGTQLLHALRRSATIFLLGFLLNGIPKYNLATIRIPGVLQRIAVCYPIASVIFLYTKWRGQVVATGALLILYAILMGGNFTKRLTSRATSIAWC